MVQILGAKMNHVEKYRSDCERIQEVAKKHGYYLSLEQCAKLWEKHSDDFAAGWLIIDSDEEIEMALDCYHDELKNSCPHCGGDLDKAKE